MEKYCSFADPEETFTKWDNARIAVLPVPYDKTSTWVKGADKGPRAILEASSEMELYDIETDTEVYRQGIHTCAPMEKDLSVADMTDAVQKRVAELIEADKFVVLLGGEHSVSVGAVRAHKKVCENMSVLQLDAHADLREEYEGSPYNHACVMSRIKEICPAVQVGIRSMCAEEKSVLNRENTFFAKDISASEEWMCEAIDRLSDNVYVTIDLDVFDPSIMPSTGTPEPGGLLWYPVMRFLKEVSKTKKVIGFDVVELCPDERVKAPDFTAAKLVYKFLSYIFDNEG